jgi:hypothetical protein
MRRGEDTVKQNRGGQRRMSICGERGAEMISYRGELVPNITCWWFLGRLWFRLRVAHKTHTPPL